MTRARTITPATIVADLQRQLDTPALTFDAYGHALIDGERACDAYGHMTYTLSAGGNANGPDSICFDASALPDGRVELVAVINCETASFIEDFHHAIVAATDAEAVAERMIDAALDWFGENWPSKRVVGKRSIATFRKDLRREISRARSAV